ncbi:MAG: nucleotidyltransferase domain-containing protein [Thermincola sp.]|nr:nucleotidyltransferase domain-containing protein [Thermincola sp.]MDT3703822.1 nucleotidyltransferase domain-containing protein [Thermincola sp.]
MKELIKSELQYIELTENVKIIYACESGSRAWGFPSKDSDYDVRFIYLRPSEWYLSIFENKDVIEKPISDLMDINGWDLCKALKLLRKSNPPLYEWLHSPIVYHEDSGIVEQIRQLAKASFNPRSCMHHYLHTAKGNFREYLQGDFVRAKKYFYVLRPVLACRWIEANNSMPPTEFEKLLALVHDEQLLSAINELLNRKKAGDELDSVPKIIEINEYLVQELKFLEELVKTTDKPEPESESIFNKAFRNILEDVWGKNFSR